MIIHLKVLNKDYLVCPRKFQMKSVKKPRSSPRLGDWMIRLTGCLSSCSHSSKLSTLSSIRSQMAEVQVQVLSFAISISPWLITTPVIRFAHLKLVRMHGYIDTFLSTDQEDLCVRHSTTLKSELVPTQDIVHTGARFKLLKHFLAHPEDGYLRARVMIISTHDQTIWWISCPGMLTSL